MVIKTVDKVPENRRKVPEKCRKSAEKPPESAGKTPTNEQERQICKYVLENNSITTAQVMELLDVKQRRAREILLKMVESACLRKEGASRRTIYVINTEEVM